MYICRIFIIINAVKCNLTARVNNKEGLRNIAMHVCQCIHLFQR